MNNDLISREALKKAMRKSINERYKHWDKRITVADIATLIFDEIDNAPTVSPYKAIHDELHKGEEEQAIIDGQTNFSRPQGEWICKTKSTFPQYQPDEYRCPFCNVIVHRKTNYCEYCGAKMSKGGEEK